jgi:hypothetical protein
MIGYTTCPDNPLPRDAPCYISTMDIDSVRTANFEVVDFSFLNSRFNNEIYKYEASEG